MRFFNSFPQKLLLAASLGLAGPVLADLNISAGGYIWDAAVSGSVKTDKQNPWTDQQLGLSDDQQTSFYVQLDHLVPVIPNLRFTSTELDFSGSGTNQVDLSHTDITAYYRLLDGITSVLPVNLRLELGLTVRLFDGQLLVPGDVQDLDAALPLGYAALQVGLPLGLSLLGSVNAISYDGSSLTDYTAEVRYEYDGLPLIKPGVRLGYRDLTLDLDDLDDVYADLTVDGAFAGVYLKVGF